MIRLIFVALLFAIPARAQDPLVYFGDDDAEMNAAITGARDTFDTFWQRAVDDKGLTKPGASIKVAIPYGNDNFEHIWMSPCKKLAEIQFVCIIANEPNYVDYKLGKPYAFLRSDISDWMVMREDGKIEGGYTLRVMLPRLPKDQAADFEARLVPLEE